MKRGAFHQDPATRPKLRCPACGAEVTLPAWACPDCGADLRTSYLKKKRPRRRLMTMVFAGFKFCLLAAAVSLLWKHAPWHGLAPSAPAAAPAGLTAEERRAAIAAAPAEFHRLAGENPLLLLPYIYVYRGKTAAQRYQEQFKARYSQLAEIEDLQDLAAYQKATPGQRQLMLDILWKETRP